MSAGRPDFAAIDGYFIDCTVREGHEFESDVSDLPIEKGGDITDNILNRPAVVTLECIVSDTPVGDILSKRNVSSNGQPDVKGGDRPSTDAYLFLLTVRDKREPVDLTTSLGAYQNMALKRLSIPRSASDGEALQFSATFVQADIRENTRGARVAIPIAKGGRKKIIAASLGKPMSGIVYIGLTSREWYDDNIRSWRQWAYAAGDAGVIHTVDQDTSNAFVVSEHLPSDSWQVVEDKPDFMTQGTADSLTVDQFVSLVKEIGDLNKKHGTQAVPGDEVAVDLANGTIIAVPGSHVYNRGPI